MYAKFVCLIFLMLSVILPLELSSQTRDLFTFSAVHKLEERNSYSIFYPTDPELYKGVVVLIHSDQASNPKVYGNFIENLVRDDYIVIYPSYQDYVVSWNKKDLEFISASLQNAYNDIRKNYEAVYNLPVAFIGHSMGGIIALELGTGLVSVPKMPSCVISICPAEVNSHRLQNMDFNKLDWYDVYLVIEEKKDKFYRRKTGARIMDKLSKGSRKRYVLHSSDELGRSRHMNLWSNNLEFSSKNNTFATYFSSLIGSTNKVDTEFYWPEIKNAMDCAFSRQACEGFRE